MVGDLIRDLFKLNRGELKKILHFALLGAFLQAGISVGLATADTLFLSQIGADQLPFIYLLTPLVFFVYIPIYSYLLGKLGIDRVFEMTIGILIVGGLALTVGLAVADTSLMFYLVYAGKLYSVLWYIALYTLFWNFVDSYFDILDAKRLFSFLSAGAALGAAFGGALVSVLTSFLKVTELFAVWSGIALLTFPVLLLCRKSWKRLEIEDLEDLKSGTVIEETQSLLKTLRGSPYAILLGSTLFTTMIVTLVCEYQYSEVFSKHHDEAGLANLFGTLYFGVHLLNLFINLFVFNRLALFLGIRNLGLIQPCCYAMTFLFFLFDNSYYAGVIGFVAYHGILTSIDYNATNLLLNALPAESKRQLRTFIEGICEPTANAVAGVFLIFVVAYLSPEQIATIGLLGACLCLTLVVGVRLTYLDSMISNLKQGWLDFSVPTRNLLSKLDTTEVEELRDAVIDNNALIESLAAIEVLMGANKEEGIECLLRFLESSATETERENATLILAQILSDADSILRVRISDWLKIHQECIPSALRKTVNRFNDFIQEGFVSRGFIRDLLAVFSRPASSERMLSLCILNTIADVNSVKPLLLLAPDLTPRERRRVENTLYTIGLKGIPIVLSVLREKNSSYQARSIAARSVAKLAFPQLEAISQELILSEIKRVYELSYYEWLLEQDGTQNAGVQVLRRVYQDLESRKIAFVLELLTLSGKLASYELIASSLRSGNKKERGNAIETVQQACPRHISHLLLPLLSALTPKDKAKFYFKAYKAEELTVDQVLQCAFEVGNELESAAAAQAIWEMTKDRGESDGLLKILAGKLKSLGFVQAESSFLKETLITLLCRAPEDANSSQPTDIERMAHLLRASVFNECPAEDLRYLAKSANIRRLGQETIYRRQERAGSLFVVCEGRVISTSADGQELEMNRSGDVFGAGCLYGEELRVESTKADGCVILEISSAVFRARAESEIEVVKSIIKNSLIAKHQFEDNQILIVQNPTPRVAPGLQLEAQ